MWCITGTEELRVICLTDFKFFHNHLFCQYDTIRYNMVQDRIYSVMAAPTLQICFSDSR